MFKNFFCYLSQTDRAFQSYKNFGSNPSTGYAYSSAYYSFLFLPYVCDQSEKGFVKYITQY